MLALFFSAISSASKRLHQNKVLIFPLGRSNIINKCKLALTGCGEFLYILTFIHIHVKTKTRSIIAAFTLYITHNNYESHTTNESKFQKIFLRELVAYLNILACALPSKK